MRFDVTALSPEELVVLIADAKRALYPEALIVGDELECSVCHERGTPELIEDGRRVPSLPEVGTAALRPCRRKANDWCSNASIASSGIGFPLSLNSNGCEEERGA